MAQILLEHMHFFAYHGCFEEEQKIGNRFVVDLSFHYNTKNAEKTDWLKETIDYQEVYKVVSDEMAKPSKLLEHVGRRIVDALKIKFKGIKYINLKISKCNPPIGGELDKVSVVLEEK